jgi:bifunctional enzyme CysN/CysC
VKIISEQGIAEAVAAHSRVDGRGLLCAIICGSAGAGKSTLIDRLLRDAPPLAGEQHVGPAIDSQKHGTEVRGTAADVVYCRFATARRRFVIADTVSRKNYNQNLVVAAANSDLAILLVDAEKGLLEQTRRHAFLCSLLGMRHFVLVVNKMDRVGFDERRFQDISESFAQFARRFSAADVIAIPVSALAGDNIISASARLPWYRGPSLLESLETVALDQTAAAKPLRLLVQDVNMADAKTRGYAGRIASGTLHKGTEIFIPRTGDRSRIGRIMTMDGECDAASAPDAVTVMLDDAIDVTRGDIISSAEMPAQRTDAFAAHLVWMSEMPLLPGRTYLLKSGGQTLNAMVTEIKFRIDSENFDHLAAKELHRDEIAFANIATVEPISFDPYEENRDTGGFILVDRHSDATVAAGLIRFGLRRAANTYFQSFEVTKTARARLNAQKPALLWFTGLSGAGKSTIADHLEKKLHALGKHTFVLDGDNVRHGLNRDLGFTEADRVENIRRVAEVAKLFVDAGLITLVAFISPFQAEREMARELMAPGEFIEIFVNTPLAACEQRDPKGLYKKARRGELQNFTGLDSPYEPPENPELVVDALNQSASDLADRIIDFMHQRGLLS